LLTPSKKALQQGIIAEKIGAKEPFIIYTVSLSRLILVFMSTPHITNWTTQPKGGAVVSHSHFV